MIYERKFYLASLAVILLLGLYYLISIDWTVSTYQDWLEYEVIYGNYFQNWTWQVVLVVPALLYWLANYRLDLQRTVRLVQREALAKVMIRRTSALVGCFACFYYLIPWVRLFSMQPTVTEWSSFLLTWFGQVVLAALWLLTVIYLILLAYSYWQKQILFLSLLVLVGVTAVLHVWPFEQSIYSNLAMVGTLTSNQLPAVLGQIALTATLMVVILLFLQGAFKKALGRWEWFE